MVNCHYEGAVEWVPAHLLNEGSYDFGNNNTVAASAIAKLGVGKDGDLCEKFPGN